MSSWADESEQPDHGGGALAGAPAASPSRPRLKLKPRSAKGVAAASGAGDAHGKSNPFGAAKPREEVLASKGIDAHMVDTRIEKKAAVRRFTLEQDKDVEKLRGELTKIEEDMREANENELPEEEFRVAAEVKRKELNDLMAKFAEANLSQKKSLPAGGATEKQQQVRTARPTAPQSREGDPVDHGNRPKYERPSERRRRIEQQRRGEERGGGTDDVGRGGNSDSNYRNDRDGGDETYASFGGRNRTNQGVEDKGGYDRGDEGRGHDNNRDGDYGRGSGGNNESHSRGGKNDYSDNYAGDRYNY